MRQRRRASGPASSEEDCRPARAARLDRAQETKRLPLQPQDAWQWIDPPETATPSVETYPARLPDGDVLHLPILPLGTDGLGIAPLLINQASFEVKGALADRLAEALRPFAPEVVAGLPTLGLQLARAVAQRLGHARFAPLGTSRKFWYGAAFSTPLSSITSPEAEKRLYLDPRLAPALAGRRVARVGDVISTGASMCVGLEVLRLADVRPVALGAAMLETSAWRGPVSEIDPGLMAATRGVLEAPLLLRTPKGSIPRPD